MRSRVANYFSTFRFRLNFKEFFSTYFVFRKMSFNDKGEEDCDKVCDHEHDKEEHSPSLETARIDYVHLILNLLPRHFLECF